MKFVIDSIDFKITLYSFSVKINNKSQYLQINSLMVCFMLAS